MPFIEHGGKRILFVHIPKTGGGAVCRWLAGIAPLRMNTMGVPGGMRVTPQHLRLSDLDHIFGEGFFDWGFAVVRNPFDRIASEYRMQASLARSKEMFRSMPPFGRWLEQAMAERERMSSVLDNHLRPQWEFLGRRLTVLRYEAGLEAGLAWLAETHGLPAPGTLERRNDPGAEAEPVAWDLPDIMRIRDAYARDFELLGYDRDPPAG